MVLVYMLVRFLWTYIKRFIVVAILTLMAPLVGVIYSLDKIRDNKAQSFEKWLKEYFFNVIIQSVHALLYVIYVKIAFSMAGDSVQGVFVAVFTLMFLLKAESLFKQIFGIKSGNMTDVLKKATGFVIGAKAAKAIAGANMKVLGKIASPVTKPIKNIHSRANEIRRNAKIDKLRDSIDRAKAAGRTSVEIGSTSSGISSLFESRQTVNFDAISNLDSYEIASKLFSKKEALDKTDRKELSKRTSQTLNTLKGIGAGIVSIPSVMIDGAGGAAPIFMARNYFKKGITGCAKNSKNYRAPKGFKEHAKNIALNAATMGWYGRGKNLGVLNSEHQENRSNTLNNAQYEILKSKLDNKERKEFERLLEQQLIDDKELKTIFAQAKTKISEDVIQDIIFRADLNMSSNITLKIEEIARTVPDINNVTKSVNAVMKKQHKDVEFDKDEFKTQLEKMVRQRIADSSGQRAGDISYSDVESAYSALNDRERKEIISSILDNTTSMTEKRMEKDKWRKKDKIETTGMDLRDVNNIVDTISKETGKLNVPKFFQIHDINSKKIQGKFKNNDSQSNCSNIAYTCGFSN